MEAQPRTHKCGHTQQKIRIILPNNFHLKHFLSITLLSEIFQIESYEKYKLTLTLRGKPLHDPGQNVAYAYFGHFSLINTVNLRRLQLQSFQKDVTYLRFLFQVCFWKCLPFFSK